MPSEQFLTADQRLQIDYAARAANKPPDAEQSPPSLRGFINITFQDGPASFGINGCQVEDVIAVLVARLRALSIALPCRENSLAITRLEEAEDWLHRRTRNRIAQGVEGTMEPHDSGGYPRFSSQG